MIKDVIYSGPHTVLLLPDFGPQLQATLLSLPQADQLLVVHPSQPFCFIVVDVLDTNLRRGATELATPKTRFRMVFLVGTAAYIGPAPHLDVVPWLIFYSSQSPPSIHYR